MYISTFFFFNYNNYYTIIVTILKTVILPFNTIYSSELNKYRFYKKIYMRIKLKNIF